MLAFKVIAKPLFTLWLLSNQSWKAIILYDDAHLIVTIISRRSHPPSVRRNESAEIDLYTHRWCLALYTRLSVSDGILYDRPNSAYITIRNSFDLILSSS